MRSRWAGRLATLVLVLPVPAAAGDAMAIRHVPVRCVPAERYARITAAATPAEKVARADLQFRVRSDGEWYSVGMAGGAGEWSAMLPRPNRRLAQFEYRIVMAATDLATVETPAFAVTVAEDPARCDAEPAAVVSVAAPIVVRVPPGAPLVPPVPSGFSPAGVVAPEGPAPRDKWKAVKWIAGAGAAAGISAAAAGVGPGPPELPPAPDFTLSGTVPNPGGDLSMSRDHLTVFVVVSGDPRAPVTFTWFFGLQQEGRACVTMFDTATVGPTRPITIELSAVLRASGFCGTTYPVDSGKLSIVVDGQVVHEVTQELPFRIVP